MFKPSYFTGLLVVATICKALAGTFDDLNGDADLFPLINPYDDRSVDNIYDDGSADNGGVSHVIRRRSLDFEHKEEHRGDDSDAGVDENLHKRSSGEVKDAPQPPPAPYSGIRGGIGWWPWNNGVSTVRRSYFIPRLGKRTSPADDDDDDEQNFDEGELTPAEAEVLKELLMRNLGNDYLYDDQEHNELMTRDERSDFSLVPRLGKKEFSFSPRLGKKAFSFSPRLGKKAFSFSPRLGKKAYSFSPRLGKKAYSFSPRLGKKAYSFSPRLGKKAYSFSPRLGKKAFSFSPRLG